ncbi:MAG: flagellar hook-associated protein 1 [Gammaproteobacteria bacterium]|jgi:flagellar hook-associated protein 1 FlgK|nr:flagellar hook-associated protein 1 [Gammaproteobacteria bacterium]
MSDLFSTSVSGLLAFQRALDVTSNNISNVATPGYSVENANFTEQPGQAYSSGYIGSGTTIQSVTRAYDELLAGQVRSSQSSYSNFNTYATQASQIDDMLSNSTTGLTASLQSFVNSLQTVANSPSSTAQRQALLSQAQGLAQQMQNYSSQLDTYSGGIESQISGAVTQINTLSAGIANLNGQIAAGLASTGQTPNTLMDQRDQMIDQLSQYVSVNTATQADGSMNVYVGSGQPLVIGSTSQSLTATPGQYNASQNEISIVSGGKATDITSTLSGGQLGGLLAVRSQVLQPAENTLGQFSVGLAGLVNQAQGAGIDLTGAIGKPMFAVGPVGVSGSAFNTGAASVTVTRTDLSSLTADDYTLRQTGGAWTLTDKATGQPVTMTGTGTAADPFKAVGLSIVVGGGAAANGDSFRIQPTADASAGLTVLLTSPSQIAAASSIQTTAAATNTGTGAVTSSAVTDPSTWVPGTYKISFTSATAYQVTDSTNTVVGTGTYASGTPITFNGGSVTLTGTPANGDTFNVGTAGSSNVGDNSNAFALVDALNAKKLNGGTTSLSSVANNLVSQVGVQTQQAQANAAAQKSVNASAVDTRNNLSGVNLDEEAAKMVQYQQAYSACAQLIQTSNTMFNSLLSAIHG